MPDNPLAPTVAVDAGNDASHKKPSYTSIAVSGANFPPGAAVNVRVDPGRLHDTVTVGADGKFEWFGGVRPNRFANISFHAPGTSSTARSPASSARSSR